MSSTPSIDQPSIERSSVDPSPVTPPSVAQFFAGQPSTDWPFGDFQARFKESERQRLAAEYKRREMLELEHEALLRDVEHHRFYAQLAGERRDRLKAENEELRQKLVLSDARQTAIQQALRLEELREENARLKKDELEKAARLEMLDSLITELGGLLDIVEARSKNMEGPPPKDEAKA